MDWEDDGRRGYWVGGAQRIRGMARSRSLDGHLIMFEFAKSESQDSESGAPDQLIIWCDNFEPLRSAPSPTP